MLILTPICTYIMCLRMFCGTVLRGCKPEPGQEVISLELAYLFRVVAIALAPLAATCHSKYGLRIFHCLRGLITRAITIVLKPLGAECSTLVQIHHRSN